RSGMVYRPKPDLSPEMPAPYTPQVLTGERVLELAVRDAGVDHEREVMPLMLAELRRALQEIGADGSAAGAEVMKMVCPFGSRCGGIDVVHRRTRDVLRDALEAATAPEPVLVMFYRVLNALRIQVKRLIDLGGYTTDRARRDIGGHLR